MNDTDQKKPAAPTRERRAYRAAARLYADAFRRTFVHPLKARGAFRAEARAEGPDEAEPRLRFAPGRFGALRPDGSAAVADAALLYWCARVRRPRLLLIRAARGLRLSAEARAALRRSEAAHRANVEAAGVCKRMRDARERARKRAAAVLEAAGAVYVDPEAACVALRYRVRRDGPDAACETLARSPGGFGTLHTQTWKEYWGFVIVESTEAARACVPALLASLRAALEARAARPSAGDLLRAEAKARACRDRAVQLEREKRPAAHIDRPVGEAAELLAELFRRRAEDEPPEAGAGPPPVVAQLRALLPPEAVSLMEEALRRGGMRQRKGGGDGGWYLDRKGREHDRGGMER